jgi:YidC/Oxa1 family membrane protein insertase
MISSFFYHILTQPLTNILVFFYNTVARQDLGIAIILLTLFIRFLLFPLFHKSTRQQLIMQHLQPKVRAIQKEFKDDKVKQTETLMALYAEHSVNPFSGFLFLLVQIPILIVLYRIFLGGLAPGHMASLYSFVANPGTLHNTLLGLINLNERSIVLVALAAALQFVQGKLSLPRSAPGIQATPMESAARNMVFVGPLITLLIFFRLPAAVSLYWVTTSVVSIVQQVIVNRSLAHLRQK